MKFQINLSNQYLGNKIKDLIKEKFPNAHVKMNEPLLILNKNSNIENYYIFVDPEFFMINSNYVQMELLKKKAYNFIMVAENKSLVIECIRFGFFDYFLSNIITEDFLLFSERIQSINIDCIDFQPKIKKHIVIKDHKSIIKLQFSDIFFIEAYGSYSNLHAKTKFYTISKTIKSIIHNFPDTFVRVHRSYAVNLDHVKSFSTDEVIMNNETRIKISRAKKMALLKAIQKTA